MRTDNVMKIGCEVDAMYPLGTRAALIYSAIEVSITGEFNFALCLPFLSGQHKIKTIIT